MVDLRPFGKLHTVQMLKDVVRKWWGVELAFADATGYVLDHAEGKIVPPQNDFCRVALFSKEGFRRCNESVKAVRDKLRAGARGRLAVVHECHLGFDIVAARIPQLSPAELEQVMDLLELGVGQIVAYHGELKARERELVAVSRELGERYRFENIIGNSRAMQAVFRLLEKIIASDAT